VKHGASASSTDLELTTELAEEIQMVAGAVYAILEERGVCDALLERAPMTAL
jgi:hypothetical protein